MSNGNKYNYIEYQESIQNSHPRLLLNLFTIDKIKKKMNSSEKKDTWESMKKSVVFTQEIDMLRMTAIVYGRNIHNYISFTVETTISTLFQKLFNCVSKDIQETISKLPSFIEQAEMLCMNIYQTCGYDTIPVVKNTELLEQNKIVDKLLIVFNDNDLTEQIKRESSLRWKSKILWNYAKFKYST
jgi:hypothetical protein